MFCVFSRQRAGETPTIVGRGDGLTRRVYKGHLGLLNYYAGVLSDKGEAKIKLQLSCGESTVLTDVQNHGDMKFTFLVETPCGCTNETIFHDIDEQIAALNRLRV